MGICIYIRGGVEWNVYVCKGVEVEWGMCILYT